VNPRPAWLRKPLRLSPEVLRLRREIGGLGLATVCESARCPNLGECYCAGIATFLILGERCTRDCAFCAIGHGLPEGPDPAEGERIAAFIRSHSIRFAVLTSVTRDDLEDGGAEHFQRVVRDIRGQLPGIGLELLVPDFRGHPGTAERVAGLPGVAGLLLVKGEKVGLAGRLPRLVGHADERFDLKITRGSAGLLP